MADPFRNFRLHWHRLRRTTQLDVDGVTLSTAPGTLPGQLRSLIFKNTYEDAERALVTRAVKSGDRVLEIGGGIGFVGLLCARLAAPGPVVTYEANAALEPMLRANYALNKAVPELRMRAVSRDGGPVSFNLADNVVSSSLVARPEAQARVEVESDALSTVIADLKPDVLVMDVEGAEIDLLPGTDLSALRALVIELHPHVVGEAATDSLMETLRAAGFSLTLKARSNVLMERT